MKLVLGHRASILLYNILSAFPKDKKFILPANVCPVVPLTFLKAKVPFEFVDIDAHSKCLDPALLLDTLSTDRESYSGVLYVRAYGQQEDTTELFSDIKSIRESLYIIDDRCLSIPHLVNENEMDNIDMTLFSTGYSKYVELGYGGYAYIKDDGNYTSGNLPFKEQDHDTQISLIQDCLNDRESFQYIENDWLGDTAVRLNEKEYLDLVVQGVEPAAKQKNKINSIYDQHLPDDIKQGISNVWRYHIAVNDKDAVLKKIFDAGLFASSHYASVSDIFGNKKSPVAEKCHHETINLFNDHRVDEEFAMKACEIIKENISLK